jgi:diaminopimelate epimerase
MFVRYPEQDPEGPTLLEIRSFERGVETETLACGSGILASTQVGLHLSRLSLPINVATPGGFPFQVTGRLEDGKLAAWSLTGDARVLAEGNLHAAALAKGRSPSWSR